ncbi:MAG TPA: hypothetical protein VNU66_06800 [Mycobacteriales bacterium]|nr:hypothetical protein [Mycobacteriales bacterium]
MTGTLHQLWALLALRWQMLRSSGARLGVVLGALALLYLLRGVVLSGPLLEAAVLATAVELAPGAFLGFGVLALIAPLTAGGGHHVVPPDHLVAFPVRSSTHFVGGLLLAPVNLVWAVQLLALVGLTSYLTLGGSLLLGGLTTLAFVLALTTGGQAVAWLVVGARQSRTGRRVVGGVTAAVVGGALAVLHGGALGAVLDLAPTRPVVRAVIAGGEGDLAAWWPATAVLAVVAAVAFALGARACGWALRRPSDALALRGSAPVRRRTSHVSPLRALIAVDRASVWRAPALRRGGLVLLLLPGLVAAGLRVPWESLIVLPGLVAAGAGLLFGINAFALDASGSVWLASQPVAPRLVLLSKAIVLAETVLAAVLVAGLAAASRATDAPSAAQLTAVVGSGLACAAVVVASCLRSSMRRPHKAELHGPRDAVAPPGALAAASVRLAVPCAVVGMVVATASHTGVVWYPLLVASPVVLAAGLSVARSVRRWDEPVLRARVVATVASG